MGQRVVSRRRPVSGIAGIFAQYVSLQDIIKDTQKRVGQLKTDLMDYAQEHGEPDAKGHKIINLDAAEGFAGFMAQRRVSQSFDADAAERLCEAKGFDRTDYIEVIEEVSQDKVARLYAEDKITEEEFDSLITENVTYALVPVKQ